MRGIAVGDFTFEGQDYQSGDPCVEVMREGDCRGTVGGLGLLGEGGCREAGEKYNSEQPWNPQALCFLGSVAAKLHICLTPGTVVRQSGAVCPDSHLFTLQFHPRL